MKIPEIISRPGHRLAVLAVLFALGCHPGIGRAQAPDADVAGATVLTRGPVHEAFAGVVTFNPEPGIVVAKAPPEAIEELPPTERPEGDNVTWIPGYWAWDDERNDYLWVSGTWRALPPGRAWMAGYWGKTSQGYQWTSGYWADATAKETTYLPAPPATVEAGPNIEAPSVDYDWAPGGWIWYQDRYAWSPGYWELGRADWDWCPGHYVWTPRGFIYVEGFWDYPVERRGVLFAPVYFESGFRGRHGYRYSPTIVIGFGVFSDDLFLRPRYNHYYFGDYYDPGYVQGGFYASFSFQSGRHGYDPIFSHQRWEHRSDREWEHHVEASFQDRRDHADTRPPRTWAAERSRDSGPAASRQNHAPMAMPLDQLAKQKNGPMKFQPVAKAEQKQLAHRGQDVEKSRTQRQTLEAKGVNPAAQKTGAARQPVAVKLPRSPIVSPPAGRLTGNQAPPKTQPSPGPAPKHQSNPPAPGGPAEGKRVDTQAAPRPASSEMKPASGQGEATAPARPVQSAPKPDANFQPKPEAPVHQPDVRPVDQQPAPHPSAAETKPAPGLDKPAPSERPAQPPTRQAPEQFQKGASRLMRNDRSQASHGNQSAPGNSPAAPSQPGNDRNQPNAPGNDRDKRDH
ncbi:MAG: hypothetical protein P4N60_09595 [Verrucomicrobiae bacterium]|nr:hypothetical protein [Verrucomicrobiae bacterium]